MLKYLHIENIAVIERSDIDFTFGFNVLTGETGAGKSIVIDSINAVLGERTSKDLIRAGCDKALVSALFGNLDQSVLRELREYDIYPDTDGNILINRTLSTKGNSSIKINGLPFTATALREISASLINIHGQHDSQALLNSEKHCYYIDSVADNAKLIEDYYKEFKNLNAIRKEINSLQLNEQEKEQKISLLKYQIEEIEKADIKLGEYDKLKENLKIAESLQDTQKAIENSKNILLDTVESDGVTTKLKNAMKLFSSLKEENFKNIYNKLFEAVTLSEEIAFNIDNLDLDYSSNDFNLDFINERLDLLHKIMLKYGNTEQKVLEFYENAKGELEGIILSSKRIEGLSVDLEKSKENLISLAKVLTKSRVDAAEKLSRDVCSRLEELNMSGVKFFAQISSGRYTKSGCDNVEFMISANVGEEPKPLSKIASGGELSRIMLAIKNSLCENDTVGTMIFDEIDTGISGFAAAKVAKQLKQVSNFRQVICVTHLAQIAAMADNHLYIEKSSDQNRTYTNIIPLTGEDRIKEIARIMSGSELSQNIYNSAKELLDRSKNYENL